jgi:hypothetical protein
LYKKFIVVFMAGLLFHGDAPLGAQQASSISKPTDKTPAAQTSPLPPPAQGPPKPDTLLDGTPIKLRIGRTISSADAKVGDQIDFEVLDEVKVEDVVVIAKGATALGTVTAAEPKRRMGRGGKLDINLDSVRLVDNEKAALSATAGGKGGSHTGAMVGAMAATAIFTLGGSALFLLMHGKDITIPKGTELTAYVNGDMTLQMAHFAPTPSAEGPATAEIPQIFVDANVASCDIEVDGAFAGDTPSRLVLTAGKHDISVKKKGYTTWTRSLNVSGGTIHLNAEMDAATGVAADTPGGKLN